MRSRITGARAVLAVCGARCGTRSAWLRWTPSRRTGQPLGRRSFRVVYVRIRPSRVELKCYLRTSAALDCGFEFPRARDDDGGGGGGGGDDDRPTQPY